MIYMGSKARIAKEIEPILTMWLTDDRYYVEPFAGGMNMMCNIEHSKRLASDKNNYLIAMWRFLCDGFEFPTHITKEDYSYWRNVFNKRGFRGYGDTSDEAMIGWFGFMGSFNGRFFDGGYSGHDVKGRDYIGAQIRNTLSQVEKLQGVEFWCESYNKFEIPKNAIIYCDIPYKGTKQYLTSKNFNHNEFWQWCRYMTKDGYSVFVSEYQAPEDFYVFGRSMSQIRCTQRIHTSLPRSYLYTKV